MEKRVLKQLLNYCLKLSVIVLCLLSSGNFAQEPQEVSEEEMAKNLQLIVETMKEQGTDFQTIIREKIEGSKIEPIFKRFPNLYLFIEKLIESEEALPKLYSISSAKNHSKLLYYGIFVLITFFVAFIIKKIQNHRLEGMISRLMAGVLRFLFFTGLRIFTFYLFFQKELTPTINIFKETML